MNLKQITHFGVCVYVNRATQNYELHVAAMFVYCIVCINLFIGQQHVTILVSITHGSLTNPYTTLAYKYPLQNVA